MNQNRSKFNLEQFAVRIREPMFFIMLFVCMENIPIVNRIKAI